MTVSAPRYLSGIKRVAIIGAGPAGLAAVKHFLAEKAFTQLVVFEQRASVGGVWNYTTIDDAARNSVPIPQTDPRGVNEAPIWRTSTATTATISVGGKGGALSSNGIANGLSGGSGTTAESATFISPLYDRLETNIPRQLMRFSDFDFPKDAQLFPKHTTVKEYLEAYAQDVKYLIRFETQVVSVQLNSEVTGRDQWVTQSRNLRTGKELEEVYDAVVVANGHYNVPYIPEVPGIREWNKKYPTTISHSKYYRLPEEYANKKVIVVGNSASGIDISNQIKPLSKPPLLLSSKSPTYLVPPSSVPDPLKEDVSTIEQFLPDTRSILFTDGRIEYNIDAIIYCTGYFYSYPFLNTLSPSVISDGNRVQHTYQHLLYRPHPTLSFLALPQKVIPFPVSEVQSAVLARLYGSRLALPSEEELVSWEEKNVAERGNGTEFHTLAFPRDAEYINEMHDWAERAVNTPTSTSDDKKKNNDTKTVPEQGNGIQKKGKPAPRWGPWEYWARERFPAIKKAFADLGEDRASVRSLEQVGFDFEERERERKVGGKLL